MFVEPKSSNVSEKERELFMHFNVHSNTFEEFKKQFDELMNKMTDEELIAALEKVGCVFEKGDHYEI